MPKPLFTSLILSSAPYRTLEADLKSNRLFNAYTLVSEDRLALTLLSVFFAASALGVDPASQDADDETRLDIIQKGRHPDVMIFPKFDISGTRKETVYVGDADEIVSTVHLRPTAGEIKFYIIDFAETMNPAAQNKLLKTLEEPPGSVHIILNCTKKAALLPTILSRSKIIEVPPFASVDIADAAKNSRYSNESEKIALAAGASRGSLERAAGILGDPKQKILFDTAVLTLTDLKSSQNILVNAARVIGYKERAEEIIEYIEILLRDAMALRAGGGNTLFLGAYGTRGLEEIAEMYSVEAVLEIMPLITRARARIKGYGNMNGIIDELLFGIVEKKAKFKKR